MWLLECCGALFNALMLMLIVRVLRHPFLCYQENLYAQMALLHTSLNLAHEDGEQLLVWKQLRHYLTVHRGPQLYGLAQWSLLTLLLTAVVELFIVVLNVLIGGFGGLHYFSLQFQLCAALMCLVYSVWMVQVAVSVWTTQQQHCRMQEVRCSVSGGQHPADFVAETASLLHSPGFNKLVEAAKPLGKKVQTSAEHTVAEWQDSVAREMTEHAPGAIKGTVAAGFNAGKQASSAGITMGVDALDHRLQSAMTAPSPSASSSPAPTLSGLSASKLAHIASLTSLIDYIQEHDTAPTAFGISMKPTVLQLLYGYMSSAVAAIITKYVITKFT